MSQYPDSTVPNVSLSYALGSLNVGNGSHELNFSVSCPSLSKCVPRGGPRGIRADEARAPKVDHVLAGSDRREAGPARDHDRLLVGHALHAGQRYFGGLIDVQITAIIIPIHKESCFGFLGSFQQFIRFTVPNFAKSRNNGNSRFLILKNLRSQQFKCWKYTEDRLVHVHSVHFIG